MSEISILVPYYKNPKALKFQLQKWNEFGGRIIRRLKFIIVDDGSPEPLTIKEEDKGSLDLTLYRIRENIPWNISGAKNLLVDRCETDWFLIHDIDHYMKKEHIHRLLGVDKSKEQIYHLSRMTKTGHRSKESIITIFMPRILFYKLGGYDEDFAGIRGGIDQEFHVRAKARNIPIIWRKDVVIHSCQHISDSSTTDWPRIKGILEAPKHTGKSILRFDWEKVEC